MERTPHPQVLYRWRIEQLPVGLKFILFYEFCRLLTDTYSNCKDSKHRCLVINKAGFVIMHNDFLFADIASESLEYVHVTEKEKHMAEDLINKKYMVRKQCRNLNQLRLETFFEFQLPPEGVDMLDNGESCKRYQLSHVDGSNIFLGMLLSTFNRIPLFWWRSYRLLISIVAGK